MIDNKFLIFGNMNPTSSIEVNIALTGIMIFPYSEDDRRQYYGRAVLSACAEIEESGLGDPYYELRQLIHLCGGMKNIAIGGYYWKENLETVVAKQIIKGHISGIILHFMNTYDDNLSKAASRYMELFDGKSSYMYKSIMNDLKPKTSESDILNNIWKKFRSTSHIYATCYINKFTFELPYLKFGKFSSINDPTSTGYAGFAAASQHYLYGVQRKKLIPENECWKLASLA